MSQYIQITDYDASIHRDILDAVTRSDAGAVEICEDSAVAEMRGYFAARYDVDAIFAAEGEDKEERGAEQTASQSIPNDRLADCFFTDASALGVCQRFSVAGAGLRCRQRMGA